MRRTTTTSPKRAVPALRAIALVLAIAPHGARADDDVAAPDDAPAADVSVDDAPSDNAPVDDAPVDDAPVDDEAATSGGAPGEAVVDLPDALPALDDDLRALLAESSEGVANAFDGAALVASGRIRLELDDGRDFSPEPDLQTGVTMTGRVGAELPLGPHRARVVLGDGRRFGRDDGNLTHPFVTPDALSFLYEVSLVVDLPLFGLPTVLEVGRREVTVADGRLVGRAPFDPRGRTLDGALVAVYGDIVSVRAGAFYLGPYAPDARFDPSALGVVDVHSAGAHHDVTGYLLVERDGRTSDRASAPSTIPTLGGRALVRIAFVEARAGADVQGTLVDGDTSFLSSPALHVEAHAEAAPSLSLFGARGAPVLGVDVEATGGLGAAGRSFQSPAPDVHGFLGSLDLLDMDNIAQANVYTGLEADDIARAIVSARVLAMTDPTRAVFDPLGRVVVAPDSSRTDRLLFTELDATLVLEVGHGLALVGEYGIAFPLGDVRATTPIQRLLVSIAFDGASSATAR